MAPPAPSASHGEAGATARSTRLCARPTSPKEDDSSAGVRGGAGESAHSRPLPPGSAGTCQHPHPRLLTTAPVERPSLLVRDCEDAQLVFTHRTDEGVGEPQHRHARRARARAITSSTGLEPAEPESSSASRRTASSSHILSTSESLRSSRLLMSRLARCARASGARRMASFSRSSMVSAAPRRPNQDVPVVYAPAPTARTRSHGIGPDEVAWLRLTLCA